MKSTCTSSDYGENMCKVRKKISIKLDELCSRGNHCLYIEGEKWLFTMWKKVKKNSLTITSKPHAHPHTMKKTHAKFHDNRYKTLRRVVLTRDTKGWKMTEFQCGKEDKKCSNYSRLSLSRIPRDSLKYFEISVPQHIRVERVRKTINWTITFNKWMCNLTPEVRNIYI